MTDEPMTMRVEILDSEGNILASKKHVSAPPPVVEGTVELRQDEADRMEEAAWEETDIEPGDCWWCDNLND